MSEVITIGRHAFGLSVKNPGRAKPVQYVVSEKGCHNCISHKPVHGYPVLNVRGSTATMTRLLYAARYGPIPEGLCCRHKCDNPQCINIDHIVLGTQLDNMRDKMERGRHRWNPNYPRNPSRARKPNYQERLTPAGALVLVAESTDPDYLVLGGFAIRIFTINTTDEPASIP